MQGPRGPLLPALVRAAATGDHLCNKIHKLSSGRCWWCGQDERQTRHHLFVKCAAWKPQIKELWKDVGCGLSLRVEASQGAQNGLALRG